MTGVKGCHLQQRERKKSLNQSLEKLCLHKEEKKTILKSSNFPFHGVGQVVGLLGRGACAGSSINTCAKVSVVREKVCFLKCAPQFIAVCCDVIYSLFFPILHKAVKTQLHVQQGQEQLKVHLDLDQNV